MELYLLLTLLALAVTVCVAPRYAFFVGIGGAALVLGGPFLCSAPSAPERGVTQRPIQRPANGYVGSAACRTCHPHNHSTWHDSYHRTMTQVATRDSILGDFNDVRLTGVDLSTRLFTKGDTFFAELTRTDPPTRATYPVVMTTGSHHRQAYWLAAGPRLLILPYMYLRDERRWIPRHSGYINPMCLQERPELAVLENDFDRWRTTCIKCHATNGRPAVEAEGDQVFRGATKTQAAEFGISCEACHGPGADHVQANASPLRRYGLHLSREADPTIVNPARLPHDRASDVCGQCHSVNYIRTDAKQLQWAAHGYTYRPGDNLFADPTQYVVRGRPELMPDRPDGIPDDLIKDSFWRDGMIRPSGREFNGLIDSPCYQRGQMSCLSCHTMHQARTDPRPRSEWADDQLGVGMDGNRACLQCHARFAQPEQLTRHTHHAADSSGSTCYNCHMPHTSYGILKAMRSHQISSPTVQESLATGRPNACNQCHLDRSLGWAGEHLTKWYRQPSPKLSEDETRIPASVLWAMRGDAGQRALMAWSYGWADALQASGRHWQAPYLAQLLEDRYDAVRFIAGRSLRRLPGFADFSYDFLAPPAARAAAHQQARRTWEALPRPAGGPDLDAATFRRLWSQRDDRPMNVFE